MVVSSSPYEHMIGKPNVKYVANMHGNEAVGREMMLHMILYLVQNYDTEYYVRLVGSMWNMQLLIYFDHNCIMQIWCTYINLLFDVFLSPKYAIPFLASLSLIKSGV